MAISDLGLTGSMEEGAVTFLDVLGWKGIWTRELGAGGAIYQLQGLLGAAIKRRDELIPQVAPSEESLRGLSPDKAVRIDCISDTIVMLTPLKAEIGLNIHGEICKTLICESIIGHIPVRGATCYGKFLISPDRSILVGPAIDEAASWHENTKWIGVVQTPSAYLRYHHTTTSPWIPYDRVPYKVNGPTNSYCVDWRSTWRDRFGDDDAAVSKLREHFGEMGPLTPEIGRTYLETLRFYSEK